LGKFDSSSRRWKIPTGFRLSMWMMAWTVHAFKMVRLQNSGFYTATKIPFLYCLSGNWDCGRTIPFLGIFVSNCRYCFFAAYNGCTTKISGRIAPPMSPMYQCIILLIFFYNDDKLKKYSYKFVVFFVVF